MAVRRRSTRSLDTVALWDRSKPVYAPGCQGQGRRDGVCRRRVDILGDAARRVDEVIELGVGRCPSRLYGPAVRCKSDLTIWRRLVLRFCIRPLIGTFVFLAIMDIRARPISFSERP